MSTLLSPRALNRATLARQLLLQRHDLPVYDAVTHLVGLQAQQPQNPYVGLWSRLARFDPDVLSQLLVDRAVVRIVVMRGTLHLVTAEDALVLRPLVQPVLDGELTRHSEYAQPLRTLDLGPVMAFARPLLATQPRTGAELRAALAAEFPDLHAAALAYACRNHLAIVQVPPRGLWRRSGAVRSTTLESWVDRPLASNPSIDDVVLRYFAAFGPATVADLATWSRLTGLREVVERVRSRLRPFRDEQGRELFDLPDAPRPDAATPAPASILPEYDNVLLSHADRSRFARVDAAGLGAASAVHGTILHDGQVAAAWHGARDGETGAHTMTIEHLGVDQRARSAIASEARRFLRFTEPDATERVVRLVSLNREVKR
jgi:hypothetical protein